MRLPLIALAVFALVQSAASQTRQHEPVWHTLGGGQEEPLSLQFGLEDSDATEITFDCIHASKRIRVETWNPGTDGAQLFLASGAISETVKATRQPADEFIGDAIVSRTELGVSDPVLSAFRKSGEFAKGAEPHHLRNARPDELATIVQFFSFCEG